MALSKLPNADAGTKEELNNKLLSTIDQTKKDLNMSRWIHMPKASEEYHYYRALCNNEAFVYKQLGGMFLRDSSEEGFKIMITYFKKARAIYNLVGIKDNVEDMDTIISVCTANKQADYEIDGDDACSATISNYELEAMRNNYKRDKNTNGMDSIITIRSGLLYAKGLRYEDHCIEAERLVTKLSTISRCVHGQGHKVTIDADKLQKQFMARYVTFLPDDEQFQALRYENDGEICVVTGPITKPRNTADENIYHIANNLVIPNLGCAVICHGLISASHLNGELGEVRNIKRSGTRLRVHFLKKGMKSALVKPENLRIAFELPSK